MPGGQFLELLLLKWSDFDNSKIAAGYFTHNYGLDLLRWPPCFLCHVLGRIVMVHRNAELLITL